MIRFIIPSIALALFLVGCEGGTTYTKTIDNRSSDTLAVRVYTVFGSSDTSLVMPGEATEVFWNDVMGQFVDDTYDCVQMVDSIYVQPSSGRVLQKDIMAGDNWDRESKDGRNSREDCTFTILESDLQ